MNTFLNEESLDTSPSPSLVGSENNQTEYFVPGVSPSPATVMVDLVQ